MTRRRGSGTGLLLIGGVLLLVAMCRGEGTRTQTEAAPAAAAPAPTQHPAPLSEPMQVTASALNQRTAPDGAVVGKLSAGATVSVYQHSGSWVRISPDGASPLWVSASHLCSGTGCYRPATTQRRSGHRPARRIRSDYIDDDCPCSGSRVCIGPRGGRYCITSGGNKRYGV